MKDLEQQQKTGAEIVNEVKKFVVDFKNDLNKEYQESFSVLAKESSNIESKVAILENTIKNNEELIKKDFLIFSSEFNSTCEKLSLRTQINENNLNSLDKNIQETNGRINNIRLELEKIVGRIDSLEKAVKDIVHAKENKLNNFLYPLITVIISTIITFLITYFKFGNLSL